MFKCFILSYQATRTTRRNVPRCLREAVGCPLGHTRQPQKERILLRRRRQEQKGLPNALPLSPPDDSTIITGGPSLSEAYSDNQT